MKRILYLLCVTLCIMGMVTDVSATPITEGNSVTWCFDTSSVFAQGAPYGSPIYFSIPFSVDQFDNGEVIRFLWTDEINSGPITNPLNEIGNNGTSLTSTGDIFTFLNVGSWTADEDLYLTITMVTGSVNVDPAPQLISFGSGPSNVNITGTPVSVPDASIILLLGSSLFGLGIFGRKRQKS